MGRTFFRRRGDGAGDGDRHGRTCVRRGGLSGVRLRRLLAAAVAVPVLAVPAAACSGEGGGAAEGEQSGGEQAEGGKGPGSGGGSADGDDGGGAPLDEQELRKALLKSGDVKGYRAQRNKDEDALPEQNTMESDDPRCAAITDVVDSKPEFERRAYTSGVLMKGSPSTGGSVQQVLLSSYADDGAAKWLGALKKALDGCSSFTGRIGTGEEAELRVKPGGSVGVGDDSVRFTMEDAKGAEAPTVFTVVRTGANTASFMSVSLSGEPQAAPGALVEKQHEKLADAAEE